MPLLRFHDFQEHRHLALLASVPQMRLSSRFPRLYHLPSQLETLQHSCRILWLLERVRDDGDAILHGLQRGLLRRGSYIRVSQINVKR